MAHIVSVTVARACAPVTLARTPGPATTDMRVCRVHSELPELVTPERAAVPRQSSASLSPKGVRGRAGDHSARKYRPVTRCCTNDVTGDPNRLHQVACRENALTSAYTSWVAGS